MGNLIVVRHGETNYNVEGRYTGSTDIELNEKGYEQARILAEKLKDISIDIIISSTLKRAKETARIISNEMKLPVIETNELVEKCVGVYEGLTREEAKNKYPLMWEANSPEGAETLETVEKRVHKVLHTILNDYSEDKNVLIVTHGYISKIIYKYFNNASEADFSKYVLKNCEYDEYII
jgi:broad specificity phosphatase PhoE